MQTKSRRAVNPEALLIDEEIADVNRQLNDLNYLNYSGEKDENNVFMFEEFESLYKKNDSKLPSFPVNSLPQEIKDYITAVSESFQVSVDMTATFVIGVMALCIQGKYAVRVKPDWVEPVNLYTLVVARPSERKSPVLKEITSPVFKFTKEENERRKPEIASYELQKKILSGKLKSIQESLSKAGDKTKYTMQDALDCQAELDALEEVAPMRLIVDDVTPEALVKCMSENDEKMAVVSAEGGIFGTMAGRYNDNTNIDIFLKSYSGEYFSSSRITRKGDDLEHPLLTIVLAVQPQILIDIMSDNVLKGRGLLARFMYCVPPTLVGSRKYRTEPIAPSIRNQYENLVYELLNIPDVVGERLIRLSPEADLISEQYNQWIERKLTNAFEEFEDWAGKLHGNTMRIAGIFHVIKHRINAYNVTLEADTITAAVEIAKYYLEHAKTAYDIMGLSESQDVKDAKYIAMRLCGYASNSLNGFNSFIPKGKAFDLCHGRFTTAEEMLPGLQILEQHGYITVIKEQSGKRGRPAEKIYFSPAFIEENKNTRSD